MKKNLKCEIDEYMKEKYKLHISYNNNLSLSDLNKILECLNLSFNAINRNLGINNNKQIKKMNPEIINIDKGSLILELLVSFFAPVAATVVSQVIIDKFKNKNENNITINIKESNEEVEINIHIDN